MIAIGLGGNHRVEDDMMMRALLAGGAAAFVTMLLAGGCGGRIEDPIVTSGIDASAADVLVPDGCGKCIPEASIDTGRPPTCGEPNPDLTGFTAPALVPSRPSTSSCASSEIDAYYTACLDAQSTQQTCSAFRTDKPACAQCIESQDTDAAWGALVFGSGLYVMMGLTQANVDGCLAKLGYAQCASDDFVTGQCTKFACEMQCPFGDEPSYAQYFKCQAKAEQTVCKAYADQANTSCADAKKQNLCSGTSFKDLYGGIARLFCAAGG